MRKWFWLATLWTVFVTVLCLVSFNDLPSVSVPNADKYVHAIFHFVFTLLWATYLYSRSSGKDVNLMLVRVILWSLLFGAGIEVAQDVFTANRQADLRDVGANLAGSIVAAVFIKLLCLLLKLTKRNV